MRSIFVTVAACALFAAGSAYAGDAAPKPADKDPVICKTTAPPVGTRLGGHHVCMKASEWEQRRQRAQDAVMNSQNHGQINGVHSGG